MEGLLRIPFLEGRNPELIGDVSATVTRFISLSSISRDLNNYIKPLEFMHSSTGNLTQVASPLPKEVGKIMWNFRRIFSKTIICKNTGHMIYRERSELVLLLAQERLREWMAWLLTFEGPAITLNAVIFILEISRRLPMGSAEDFDISSVVNSMLRKKTFSRNQLLKLLSSVQFGHWFSASWAARVKRKLSSFGRESDKMIPIAWSAYEASGRKNPLFNKMRIS